MPAKPRHFSNAEKLEVHKVFHDHVPDGRVWITDLIGPGGRAFLLPVHGAIPFLSHAEYYINAGTASYSNMLTSDQRKRELMHMLTHVWQMEHQSSLSSLMHRGLQFASPIPNFAAIANAAWERANFEGQATMVEHWYANGMNTSSQEYRDICKFLGFRPGPETAIPRDPSNAAGSWEGGASAGAPTPVVPLRVGTASRYVR